MIKQQLPVFWSYLIKFGFYFTFNQLINNAELICYVNEYSRIQNTYFVTKVQFLWKEHNDISVINGRK